jgi:nucleotide-binding universal stress UspA family protein
MASILVSIEEGRDPGPAIKHVIELYRQEQARVYLLNVQPPFSRHVSRFVNKAELRKFQQERGMQALAPLMQQLDAAGVPHRDHVMVGSKAETIVNFAKEYHCRQIIVAKESPGLLSWFRVGSSPGHIRKLIGSSGNFGVCEDF